ncbi:secreted in xylem 2 [Fusarium austroafricanum]|uniref:Secreted in xylem 2 n=1 Tax=Fusarium austroafricanum TaxID=2364996 RepID=A0A8H4NSW4_9HYPO|nr:secreted in xylem 2 [Fusarium austroafricanum]
MFLKGALVALYTAWTISVAASPVGNSLPDDAHLPDLRLSHSEVRALKEAQIHPPGYIHKRVTFGEGEDAVTVPIVEADVDMLLDDEKGVKARSLAPRGSCFSFPMPSSGCMIDYCWRDDSGSIYSRGITITGSNGQSNPASVTSNDPVNLSLNNVWNDGYNGWFPTGHECSNSNTQIYTDHRLLQGVIGVAYVDHVRCDNCNFRNVNCLTDALKNNLIAYSNGVASQSRCT